MTISRLVLPAGAALLICGTASAQTMGTQVRPGSVDAPSSFTKLDANKDGSISPGEAAANSQLSSEFVMLDTNGDGALEPSEFARFEVTGAASTHGTPGSPGTPGNAAPSAPPMGGTPPPFTSTAPPTGATSPPNSSTPPPTGSSPPPR